MVLPNESLYPESDWRCQNCDKLMNQETVWKRVVEAKVVANMVNKMVTSAGDIEEILFRLSTLVAHTNNLWIEAEQKLLMVYMKEKLTRPKRERIIQICSNTMQYLQHADRGNVKSRKYLSLHSCLLNSQIENLLEDKNKGCHVDRSLMKKIYEKQIINIIRAKIG